MGSKDSTLAISISKEITFLGQLPMFGNYLNEALRRVEAAINDMGRHAQIDPAGVMPAPPPVNAITVKSNGNGLVHATISDSNEINKNIHYFVEYATNPSFFGAHVAHLGASRSMPPLTLPALDDNSASQKFYFRAYSQYPGGLPGQPINFGGTVPAAVDPGGTQAMTLLESTGSGTASNSGQEAASGLGKVLTRPGAKAA